MANITKEPSILTPDNVRKIEKILGLDGIYVDTGKYVLAGPNGKLIALYEIDTNFTIKKEVLQ